MVNSMSDNDINNESTVILVGLCGTQGCGKTTLLEQIKSRPSYNNIHVEFNTSSRSVVKAKQISFDRTFYSNPELIAEFQVSVLKAMCESHYEMLSVARQHDPTIVVTDRTYTDLDAYLQTNLGVFPEFEQFIERYHKLCVLLSSICFDSVVMMPFPTFNLSVDSTRPVSKVHQRLIHATMMRLAPDYGKNTVRFGLIDGSSTVSDRRSRLENFVAGDLPKQLKNQRNTVASSRLLLLKLIIKSIDSIIAGSVEI